VKVNEVPQDDANLFEGKTRDVQYAIGEDGKYTTVKSVGWEPKNEAMLQAWDIEKKKIAKAKKLVIEGVKSPLYFHMLRCLMHTQLVASYTGFSRFKVKRHFKPQIFKKLTNDTLDKYVYAFGLKSREDLLKLDFDED
jgi:hypothetical protein